MDEEKLKLGDYGPLIYLAVVIIAIVGFAVRVTAAEFQRHNLEWDMQSYASEIREDTIMTYKNPETLQSNDFFVVTFDDDTYYVEVEVSDDGEFSHSIREFTEENASLTSMFEASLEKHRENLK